MTRRGRLCFYSEYLLPVLVPTGVPFAGGAETQLAKLARGMRARDFDVSVVTCDFGQPARIRVDDIDIFRAFRLRSPIPILRFFHPRLTRGIAALRAADAEVYYVSGSGMPAGLAYEVARSRRAGFVNHAASDYDLLRSAPRRSGARDRWWYRRAIRGADALLAQTEFQKQAFASMFGLASDVLPNLVEIPARTVDPGQKGPIVWLGTYKSIKRPEWFVDLARDLPDHRFVMVGVVPPPPLTQQHWESARAAARDLPNLEVRGFMDHDQLESLFRTASLLVHTSPVEGFSNVMLEAWSYGLPTVSCVDPDDIVKRESLGDAVNEYPELLAAVCRRMSDPAGRIAAGARAREYVMAKHAPNVVLDRLAALLDPVVERVRSRRGHGA